ncbi:MAG: YidC/Oxa1 family insertase periplasmic-domain containing protein [Planctomycetia bacterium]|nr:YidC/Oxa1 family insertase periplasmic-domain containing protein [Planctomycetia bacterium]
MDKRFTSFMILAVVAIVANQIVYTVFFAPPPPPQAAVPQPKKVAKVEPAKAQEPAAKKEADRPKPATPKEAALAEKSPQAVPQWLTLGSADPNSPYRMLVILTNRGAAIERLELNSPLYRDLEDRSGYLGQLVPGDAPQPQKGALVRIVGAGTPAAAAGLQGGDVITALDDRTIASAADLVEALKETAPQQKIRISIERDGAQRQLAAELGRQPLQVMKPEENSKPVDLNRGPNHDPFSFLLTLQQFDERILGDDSPELDGVELRDAAWEVTAAKENLVSFRKVLPKLGLQIVKTYHLQQVPPNESQDSDYPAYSFLLDISIANVGSEAHRIAYRLDGPTGLPIEGEWYANKVSRTWSGAGLRDVVAHFHGGATTQVSAPQIADPEFKLTWSQSPLDYIAVDAQYFAAAIIPQKNNATDVLFEEVKPTRVGAIPKDRANYKLTDVSFRLESKTAELAPGGPPLEQSFQIFAGPKKPNLLAEYRPPGTAISLKDLMYYGWFGWVAVPMLKILHAFYFLVGNYGLAIIMLTVLVRGGMFPLGRKQAQSAQKMQELQPEIKRISEKYKNEPEKKTRAQQELFRQHNYNPLGGCLPALVQLPIFVGLYKTLMVDVELRQAPLFGDSIRWASNLAAPDMLWNWSAVVPDFISHGTGFLGLGPYLNILPLVTVGLILWQQRATMPPPADEQAALQQKMMQYMMVFMGIMFFKCASGLCVYFIASSIWGVAERKLLPKKTAPSQATASGSAIRVASSPNSGNGAPAGKKRKRDRK